MRRRWVLGLRTGFHRGWSNLIKRGIDFGLGQIPGVNSQAGRPFGEKHLDAMSTGDSDTLDAESLTSEEALRASGCLVG
jgi:hypothetical protein